MISTRSTLPANQVKAMSGDLERRAVDAIARQEPLAWMPGVRVDENGADEAVVAAIWTDLECNSVDLVAVATWLRRCADWIDQGRPPT